MSVALPDLGKHRILLNLLNQYITTSERLRGLFSKPEKWHSALEIHENANLAFLSRETGAKNVVSFPQNPKLLMNSTDAFSAQIFYWAWLHSCITLLYKCSCLLNDK
jgi:hypothetical protein